MPTDGSSSLKVVRVSSKSGFWLWRKARYEVYQDGSSGIGRVVIAGQFRDHKEALRAARDAQRQAR
ncbi:MAG: hypothetical protein HY675_11780 [Chloroflexi bacterium]|nr:hypothetical protein [Chloroflexota bacterium]